MNGNDDNNGPWGSSSGGSGKSSSGRNPWAEGPSSGGPSPSGGHQPPDLDALLRQGQDKLKQMMPGDFNNARGFMILLLALGLFWLASGFYQVSAGQLGVVLRFGNPVRVEGPGLRYRLPYPFEEVLLPEVTALQKIEIGYRTDSRRGQGEQDVPDESSMLTGDENIIDVNFQIVWQVDPEKVKDFLFNIRDPERTVAAAAESVMREVIGTTDIKTALTGGRSDIEARTQEQLQKVLDQYQSGILITQVNLRGAKPPAEVADAFQDVTRARSDKETAINQAETYKSKIIPEAEGRALQMLQEADAYRQQVVNVARGNADRFTSVWQSYAQAKDVTTRQMYLETMESILRDAPKIVVDPALKGAGVTSYLPLNELMRSAPAAASKPAN